MKILTLTLGLLALCLTGCSSVATNLASFVAKLPPNTMVDATQTTSTPVYSHQESVTGMSKAADGTIIISNLKATASIPEIGVTWSFSVSGLTVSPPSALAQAPPAATASSAAPAKTN